MAVSQRPIRLGIISSQAFSLHNFRGPLIRALVERGVQVFALAPDFDETTRTAIRADGAEPVDYSLSRTGRNPFRDLVDTIGLARCLKQIAPDLTLGYFIKPVIYGTFAAGVARVPRRFALVPGLGYIFTGVEESGSRYRRVLRRVVSRMYGAAFSRCERVIFQNDDDAAWFVSRNLIRRESVVRINGTGVDLMEWLPVPLAPSPPAFLLIARLLREKGISDFVEAARRVKARHPAARFMLVGGLDPGPSGLALAEVDAWVRDGPIEWAGQIGDVRPWIAQSNVYVLPSYYREGVPRSTQEAMAMGRPVITTDSIGCRETVVEGVNGFLVPVRNPTALAAAMERFIENPDLIQSMGRESRRLAEERFDARKINEAILNAMGL